MSTPTRPNWDDYYLDIAKAVSARADCRRRQHGAVVVNNNQQISAGYNGAPAGQPGCLSGACPRGLLSYQEVATMSSYDTGPGRCGSIHAETNALLRAGYDRAKGGTIYITGEPCLTCWKTILGAGINRAVWRVGTTIVNRYAAQGVFV